MSSLYQRMVLHSQANRRRGSCERKVPYQTEDDARIAMIRVMVDQDIEPDARHHPYKCTYCRYWHFTSHGRKK